MANDYGNTNGQVPSFDTDVTFAGSGHGFVRSWLSRRVANVLPSHYARRFVFGGPPPTARIGGGSMNDGVFFNLTAKPEVRGQRQTGA
jgi:hypothetical protein